MRQILRGQFFELLLALLERKTSLDIVSRVIDDAQLPHGGAYTPLGLYDIEEFERLLGRICVATGLNLHQLLKQFGYELVGSICANADLSDAEFSSFAFFEKLNAYMLDQLYFIPEDNEEVRKLYPDDNFNLFTYEQIDEDHVRLVYASQEPLLALAEGAIEAVIAFFGETIDVQSDVVASDTALHAQFFLHKRDDGNRLQRLAEKHIKLPELAATNETFDVSQIKDVSLLQKMLIRERIARREAENIAEQKTREVYAWISHLARSRDDALEANRTKSQFLANMSHELRTPLNAIIGYSEMLLEDAEDAGEEMMADDLRKIQSAGQHLLSLINDILDISKIEAGKMDLYLERVSVGYLVNDIRNTILPVAAKNGNELVVDCSDDIGDIDSDVTKLRQALFNLLSNASKFTQNGVIRLSVQRKMYESRDWIEFAVSDTGIGMSESQLGRIFEAFTQADASTTRKFGGTGLGLAISRSFCQLMGGDIRVQSEQGKGSCFTISLPVNTDVIQATGAMEMGDEVEEGARKKTILVIDDDASVQDLMKRILTKEGYRAVMALNGTDGIHLAKEHMPDMILLDVLMPGMDGWTVLNTLQNDATLSHIPIIMVSMADEKAMAYALGADAFLIKPVQRDRLMAILERHLTDASTAPILVVEDDGATRDMLKKMLERENHLVMTAENGRIALEKIRQRRPKCIILDLMMPEVDGFVFASEVRRNEEWAQIPIVVMTGKDLTSDDKALLGGMVDGIIQKGETGREALLEILRERLASPLV